MKNLNKKGFTLIELLAVITIMGILMIVAIPTVSRTIENSRKDTFIDTMKSYVNGASNMWAADNLKCGEYLSSAVPEGTYYVNVDTSAAASHPVLLEKGGKSSWGSRDIKGYIKVVVDDTDVSRDVKFYPILTDGVHGVNVVAATPSTEAASVIEGGNLVRGNIIMSGAGHPANKSGAALCVEV